jgi:hypothetical protein
LVVVTFGFVVVFFVVLVFVFVVPDDCEPLVFVFADGSASVVAVEIFEAVVLPFFDAPDFPVVVVAAGVVVGVAALCAVESDFLSPPPQPASARASSTPIVAMSFRGTARTIASGA